MSVCCNFYNEFISDYLAFSKVYSHQPSYVKSYGQLLQDYLSSQNLEYSSVSLNSEDLQF